MKAVKELFIKYKFIILVVLFSLLAVLDLSNYGIPPTHDGEYHVLRFQQFYKVLSEGVWYPRWAPDFNNGFGIPLFNYVYPLPNYFAAIFHAVGFGFIDSLKLNMAAAAVVGSIFMYLWARRYWGEVGAVVSSVFYTFSPYHLLDIYVRGSVGEVWSLGLAPGLLWSYLSFHETQKRSYLVLSSIFLALLVLAHNILALVFFGFFIVYAGFLVWSSIRKKKEIRSLVLIIFSGLGLSSPFWLPAILETKYVVGLQIVDPTAHFPILYKLIYSSWGYGFSGSNVPDQMSFQIGIANLIAFFGSIVILFLSKNKRALVFFISLFLITVFLITPFSIFIWKSLPLMSYIQFPWRLLSVTILIASFLAGSIVADSLFKEKIKTQTLLAVLLVILSISFAIRYAKAPFYHKRADQHYLTRSNFTDGTNSPGDSFNTKWLAGIPKKEKNKIEITEGSGKLKIDEVRSESYKFVVDANSDSKILIHTAYFPGWKANVDKVDTPIINDKGKMLISVPKGKHNIIIRLDSTFAQKLSYIYFLISILLIIFIGKSKKFLGLKS